ncbi:MAG TPA: discoidin domain-containing protein [Thermoanaerobaculia bacterium]|nr:discoidin domain-containing protein [Thermoanaerobaculia bacterium]
MRNATALLVSLLALIPGACTREEPVTTATTKPAEIPKYTTAIEADFDTDNLLNLAYGASVVSRTAEATIDSSAVHAIDSTMRTGWMSPPSSPEQTIVFSLLVPARLERIGVLNSDADIDSPSTVTFETSSDGVQWRLLQTLQTKGGEEPQLWDVTPTVAHYIRVSTTGNSTIAVRSFQALGVELQPPVLPPLEGCWRINDVPARFARDGATITGILGTTPPTLIDGGTNGRVVELMWTQGPMWGYGVITLAPNAATLSGLRIHEEISTQQYGEGWFGDRVPCDGITLAAPQPGTLTSRAPNDRWSAYGIVFDANDAIVAEPSRAALDALAKRIAAAPSQRFRITAHELRNAGAVENRRQTEKRIASLRAAMSARGVDGSRLEFVSAGDQWSEPPIATALQRLMASRIDLERFGR